MPCLPLGNCGVKTVNVRVLPTSTTTLWIHRGDVPWLVAYIADEVAFGGVEDTEYLDLEDNEMQNKANAFSCGSELQDTWLAHSLGLRHRRCLGRALG